MALNIYETETSADTIAYQLMGLLNRGHTYNSTQTDYFKYDGGCDYISILRTTPGKVRITFDPAKVFRAENKGLPLAQYDDSHKFLKQCFQLASELENEKQKLFSAYSAHRKAGKDAKDFKYDISSTVKKHQFIQQQTPNLYVRQLAALQLFEISMLPGGPHIPGYEKKDVLAIVAPTAPAWAYKAQYASSFAAMKDLPQQEKILQDFITNNPVRKVRGNVLSTMTYSAFRNGEMEKFRAYYNELKEKYSDLPEPGSVLKRYDPDRAIQKK